MCDWPTKNPDFTPCDFVLWGLVKGVNLLYQVKILEELGGRIEEVTGFVPQRFLAKSVYVIPGQLEKQVTNSDIHIGF